MKDIIFKFKSEEDYNIFLEDLRSDNEKHNFFEESENDNSITMTFEDSETLEEVSGGGSVV